MKKTKTVNVAMKKATHTKAKKLQKDLKLATISDAIDVALSMVKV